MRCVMKVTASVDNQQGTCHSHYHPPQCPLLNMESHYSPSPMSGELGSAHICALGSLSHSLQIHESLSMIFFLY